MPRAQTPQAQLESLLALYPADVCSIGRATIALMKRRFPGAVVFVYDKFDSLVVGFGPTDRPSKALFSIALYPRHVNLFFLTGARLSDPERVLEGAGAIVRRIRLNNPAELNDPRVADLMDQAAELAGVAMDEKSSAQLLIKMVSKRKRKVEGIGD
jgi:hypothetical protein